MKYIKKGQEPQIFSDWKAQENDDWKTIWNTQTTNFQAPERPIVHEALLKEQGYICCYCGRRINKEISHIEHLQSRTKYPEKSLDYSNFLASCPGEGEEADWKKPQKMPPSQKHCGHKKSDWYDDNLMVSPLRENCADYFIYTGFGEILPSKDSTMEAAATETIERLGLNHRTLQRQRRKEIEKLLPLIDGCSEQEIQQLILGYKQLDSEGKYIPFCAAILYILKTYF